MSGKYPPPTLTLLSIFIAIALVTAVVALIMHQIQHKSIPVSPVSPGSPVISSLETFHDDWYPENHPAPHSYGWHTPKTLQRQNEVRSVAQSTDSTLQRTVQNKGKTDQELREAKTSINVYEQQLLQTEKALQDYINARAAAKRAEEEKRINIPVVPNIEIVRVDKALYDVKQLDSIRGSDWITIAFLEQSSACLNINTWSHKGDYDRSKCAHADEAALYMHLNNDGCHVHRSPSQAFTQTPVCANIRNFYNITRYYQPARKVLQTPTPERWLQYMPLRFNSYMQYVEVFDLPSAMRAANVLCNRTPTPCVYNFSPSHYMVELFGARYQFKTKDIEDEKIWVNETSMKLPWQILIHRPVFVRNRVSNRLYRIRINNGTYRLNETYSTVQLEKASTLIFATNATASPPNSMIKNNQFTFYSMRLIEVAEQYMGVASLYFEFKNATFSNILIPNKGLLRAIHVNRQLKIEFENEFRKVHSIFSMPMRFPVKACVFTFFQSAICVYIDAEDGYYYHQVPLNNGLVIQTLFMDLFRRFSDPSVVYGIFSVADMLETEPLQSPYSALSY